MIFSMLNEPLRNFIVNEPIGYIYETICLINDKTYIGLRHYLQDKGKEWTYYLGSGSLIKAAISKYGSENFSKRKLSEAYSEKELQLLEWEFIRKAKNEGKAEYNLFTGLGAGGDTFSRLTPERLAEARKKQSDSVKNFRARTAEMRANKFREAYEKFRLENQDAVIKKYEELGAVKGLTEHFDASPTWLRRVLRDNKITVKSVNSLTQNERAKLQSNYDKTSLAMLKKKTKNGMAALELHDYILSRIDEFQLLRKTFTRRQLEEHFNVTHEWLNVFLRDHKIPKKTDTVVDSSTCRRCRLSSAQNLS